ncbi:MAG: helix-turn-helix transcriptional regulator [Nannocystaceae bacterium]
MDHDHVREQTRARLAARIREACKARKITITHLAATSGMSRNHLFGILAGRKSPTVDYLMRIARALEVKPAALLGDKPITPRARRVRE